MTPQEYFEENKVAMMRQYQAFFAAQPEPKGQWYIHGFCRATKELKRDRMPYIQEAFDILFSEFKREFEIKYALPSRISRFSHWWAPKWMKDEGSIIIPLANWYTVRIAFLDELIKKEEEETK